MKHFDRLFNMVMEDINSSKLQRRGHIVSEGKCSELRKLHCITVGQAKAQLAKLDPSTPLKALSLGQDGKIQDEDVIMGFEDWSDDYAVIDRDGAGKAMTAGELLNKLQDIPDNRFFACLAFATYAHTPDYVKEIQPDGTIIVDMAWFPYNGEQGAPCRLDLQSVKVDKSKKVIKESARRHTRRHLIKESVTNVEDYKKFLNMCADIVKKAGEAGKQAFIDDGVNEDTSCTMDQDLQNYNITLEQWENAVKYGWIVDSLPFAIDYTYDDCFEEVMTPEEQEQIEEFVSGDDHQFTNYFFYTFCKGDTADVEFCKQLCEKLGVTDPDKEALMINEYFEGDNMDYESVKKPVSKRRVIKEHRAHRPSRRRQVIKESARRHARRIRK